LKKLGKQVLMVLRRSFGRSFRAGPRTTPAMRQSSSYQEGATVLALPAFKVLVERLSSSRFYSSLTSHLLAMNTWSLACQTSSVTLTNLRRNACIFIIRQKCNCDVIQLDCEGPTRGKGCCFSSQLCQLRVVWQEYCS
jgi:hypothetical protein